MSALLALKLNELAPGQSAAVDFVVTASDMLAFANLSGDHNPLHVDDDFARNRGFLGRVVYGALLAAKVSQLIGMRLPGRDSVWTALSLDFRKPLYIGEAARAEGVVEAVSESGGIVRLKLTLRAGEKLLAKGKAEVVVGQ